MPGRLLMLQCADINQHTSVNLGFSSLAFFTIYERVINHKNPNSCRWVYLVVHYWNTMTHKQILQRTSLNQFRFGI